MKIASILLARASLGFVSTRLAVFPVAIALICSGCAEGPEVVSDFGRALDAAATGYVDRAPEASYESQVALQEQLREMREQQMLQQMEWQRENRERQMELQRQIQSGLGGYQFPSYYQP